MTMNAKVAILFAALTAVVLSGCDMPERSKPLGQSGMVDIFVFCDPERGVEYLVFDKAGDSAAVTPRLKADGTLFRCEVKGDGHVQK